MQDIWGKKKNFPKRIQNSEAIKEKNDKFHYIKKTVQLKKIKVK